MKSTHLPRTALLAAACAACVALPPTTASAEPFAKGDLFVGRALKPSSSDKLFDAGATFQIAPVKAVAKSVVDRAREENPEVDAIIEYLPYVPTDEIRAVTDLPQDQQKAALLDLIRDNVPEIDESELQKVDEALGDDAGEVSQRVGQVVDVLDIIGDPSEAIAFSIDPYFAINSKYVKVRAQIPVAGVIDDDGTRFSLGNLGLDLSTGSVHGTGLLAFGWTVGVASYAPTGTPDSNQVALSNILATPRYLHEYLSINPYAVLGVDLAILELSVRGEYVHMLGVRNDPIAGDMAYANVGAGAVIDLVILALTLEIDGLLNIDNAPAMDNVWFATAGLRFDAGPLMLGAAAQIPLKTADDGAYGSYGPNFGEPGNINALLTARVGF